MCVKNKYCHGVLPTSPRALPGLLPNGCSGPFTALKQSRQGWAEGSKEKLSLLLCPLEVWNPLPDLIILSPAWGMAEQDRDPRG